MTEQELSEGLQALKSAYDADVLRLKKKYATDNNPYHVGDIITDRHGSGEIVKMMYYEPHRGLPCVRYRCINLTKKGEPNKREPFRDICQFDISKKEETKK